MYVRINPTKKAIALLDMSLSLRIVALDGRDKRAANGLSVSAGCFLPDRAQKQPVFEDFFLSSPTC